MRIFKEKGGGKEYGREAVRGGGSEKWIEISDAVREEGCGASASVVAFFFSWTCLFDFL